MYFKRFALVVSVAVLTATPIAYSGPYANSNTGDSGTGTNMLAAPQLNPNNQRLELGENIQHQLERGIENFESGDFKTASLNLKRVLRSVPHHVKANLLMGLSQQKLGRHKDAIKYLKKSRKQYGSVPQVHVALGQSYVAVGNTRQANKVLADIKLMAEKCAGSCTSKIDIETARVLMERHLGP